MEGGKSIDRFFLSSADLSFGLRPEKVSSRVAEHRRNTFSLLPALKAEPFFASSLFLPFFLSFGSLGRVTYDDAHPLNRYFGAGENIPQLPVGSFGSRVEARVG